MENKKPIYIGSTLFILMTAGIFLINTGETIAYPQILEAHIVNFESFLGDVKVNWQMSVQLNETNSEVISRSFLVSKEATEEQIENEFKKQVETTFNHNYPKQTEKVSVDEKVSELEEAFKDKKTLSEIEAVQAKRADDKRKAEEEAKLESAPFVK